MAAPYAFEVTECNVRQPTHDGRARQPRSRILAAIKNMIASSPIVSVRL